MASSTGVAAASGSLEDQALAIVEAIRAGTTSISDIMGPLMMTKDAGDTVNPTPKIPPGGKKVPTTAPHAPIAPMDEHNTRLVDGVHPPDHVNPAPAEKYDLVVIGAGVAGLLSVIMGKALGKKCVLIEKHYMGGDCLNVGCFPSKAVIECARRVHEVKTSASMGVRLPEGEVTVDFGFIMERMRRLRADIGANIDSVARYKKDFCEEIYLGHAKFTGADTIEVEAADGSKSTLRFDKAMVATGGSAWVPPGPGLGDIEHLTNGNIFNMTEQPKTMIVVGAGPIGMELAQSFQRFGTQVTVLERGPHFLPREDPDASELVRQSLERDGVDLKLNVVVTKATCSEEGGILQAPFKKYVVTAMVDGKEEVFHADAVLNGTGRVPNVHNLGLEAAGVEYDSRVGVTVDDLYRTANPNVYATGDVVSAYKFTHTADWSARIAIRNMFLGDANREENLVIPWCTYVDPEVAHVGMYERDLKARNIEYETFLRPIEHVDRYICEGVKDGFVKIHVKAGTDTIVGATIVAPNAGDMISEITTCIQYNIGAGQLAGVQHPYPTRQEAVRQCAAQYNKNFKTPVNKRALEILMEQHSAGKSA